MSTMWLATLTATRLVALFLFFGFLFFLFLRFGWLLCRFFRINQLKLKFVGSQIFHIIDAIFEVFLLQLYKFFLHVFTLLGKGDDAHAVGFAPF